MIPAPTHAAPDLLLAPAESARLRPTWICARRLAFVVPALGLPLLATGLAAVLTVGTPAVLRMPLLLLLFANLQAVFAAVEVMARALIDQKIDRTDIFVLSDTRDAGMSVDEAASFARVHKLFGDRVRYRRRPDNARRKVGNIAEFCSVWSGAYEYMVVLDADSLMSAETIASMIGLMDANPRTGLIQTVPYAVGRETLFARIQQFAARLYTPLLVDGLAFWQQDDSNYWGHNAIIRIAPFVEHCALPVLPGKEPFGGEILCHDVVEAGLMRRGGWQVWMLPSLGQSYEALPANMVDFAQRERRWCQGNLQHLGVLPMHGLRPVGRYHMALGVLNYLSGPLLFAFTALALLDALLGGEFVARLLGTPGLASAGFVLLTFLLLYAAKLCSLGMALADDETAALFGGRVRLLASALLEQASAMASAPVLLMFYTRFILMMVLGRSVQWDAQPRDDRGVAWGEAFHRMRMPALTGLVWLGVALTVGGTVLGWSASLLPGLLLAIPYSVLTSQRSLGLVARRWGLFLTEDEVAPPAILRAYNRAMASETTPATLGGGHPQFGYLHAAAKPENS
jgi:membrane glycosyltransferase